MTQLAAATHVSTSNRYPGAVSIMLARSSSGARYPGVPTRSAARRATHRPAGGERSHLTDTHTDTDTDTRTQTSSAVPRTAPSLQPIHIPDRSPPISQGTPVYVKPMEKYHETANPSGGTRGSKLRRTPLKCQIITLKSPGRTDHVLRHKPFHSSYKPEQESHAYRN